MRSAARLLVASCLLALGALAAPAIGQPASPTPVPSPVKCPSASKRNVHVSTAAQLNRALANASAGAIILLADGDYRGSFAIRASGTKDLPITICGSVSAILDGGNDANGVVLLLKNARFVHVTGIAIMNGRKGVVLDHSSSSVLRAVSVHSTGQEGVHILRNTMNAVVRDSVVYDTGRTVAKFGEAIYVGTARSNWCTVTRCRPDASNGAQIVRNTLGPQVRAEAIDVKEGTRRGRIANNTFDGTDTTNARSWVDVKGNQWSVQYNVGRNPPAYGFTDSRPVAGWGNYNDFEHNTAYVPKADAAFHVAAKTVGVVVRSNHVIVTGLGLGGLGPVGL